MRRSLFYCFSATTSEPPRGKLSLVLFTNLTSINITGTSVSTPTTVTKTTGEEAPNNVIATATDSSKKSEAPINPAGAAIL